MLFTFYCLPFFLLSAMFHCVVLVIELLTRELGLCYHRYYRDHDDSCCNGSPGVCRTEPRCMTTVPLRIDSKK